MIPPFIVREGGVIVNDVFKIHVKDPSVEDHLIAFPDESDLRIPLYLSGIFSFFHTRRPEEYYKKLFLTPDASDWNPHCASFENRERTMLDFRGDISEKSRWLRDPQVFDDSDEVPTLASVTVVQWNEQINTIVLTVNAVDDDEIESNSFANTINVRGEASSFIAS